MATLRSLSIIAKKLIKFNLTKSKYSMNKFYVYIYIFTHIALIISICNSDNAMAIKMYKWVDANGNIQFSDNIPPDAVDFSHEVINSDGITTEVIERAKTPEEIRQAQEIEKLQAQNKRLAAEQEAADQVLLRTFRTEDEMRMALNGKLEAINIQVTVAQTSIRQYQTNLAAQQYKQAAVYERTGKTIPESLKKSIQDILKRISDTYLIIRQKQQDQQALKEAFNKDIKRFRILRKLTKEEVIVEETIPTFLENLLPCGEGYACDEAWLRAEAFILKYATTPIQIQGEFIIMAKAPIKDDDISITISKIYQKNQPTMLFMDLFCKSNPKGQELCKSERVKNIRKAYRIDIGGITD
jgi:hypothetical protein